ncbi:hypothetical protein EGR_06262 [Echinococcus granulosus]|uniref:Uncharacterized protein n=1 Tax=Echinococcus granulosus TaxID=6210 RepID=W6UBS1_ECHGR|nr:hypothetical protein EGR_06262 [Echinococcus granulosus]EUB58838.1 hypothetical protein EGR_06262 [Echinococcus granulosus]
MAVSSLGSITPTRSRGWCDLASSFLEVSHGYFAVFELAYRGCIVEAEFAIQQAGRLSAFSKESQKMVALRTKPPTGSLERNSLPPICPNRRTLPPRVGHPTLPFAYHPQCSMVRMTGCEDTDMVVRRPRRRAEVQPVATRIPACDFQLTQSDKPSGRSDSKTSSKVSN